MTTFANILKSEDVTELKIKMLWMTTRIYMRAIGCELRAVQTPPALIFTTLEEQLNSVEAKASNKTTKELTDIYNNIEGCYNPLEHTIYLKKEHDFYDEGLIIHELVHSLQPVEQLVEAVNDSSDVVRLDAGFEAEAYTIQSLYSNGELEDFLGRAEVEGIDPYQFLIKKWEEKGKGIIQCFINNKP